MSEDLYNKVMALASRRGFVWGPSPEIFGGLSGFYDLGPLGKLLKDNIIMEIKKILTLNGFWEVEAPTVSPRIVWESSGHTEGFTDPIVKCERCNYVYRADKLIEDLLPNFRLERLKPEYLTKIISENDLRCPRCKGRLSEVSLYNLMMMTTVGLDVECVLRPETATTTYLMFRRLYNFFREKLPIKVFQVGKAYRNEISPRQGMMRLREFTQLEAQMFIHESMENEFLEFKNVEKNVAKMLPYKAEGEVLEISFREALEEGYLLKEAYAWCLWLGYYAIKSLGFKDENIRLRQHSPEERAHYAIDAWDIEIKTSRFGWVEVCGVHDRGNYDLSRHQKFSKVSMEVPDLDGESKVPHVLEIAFGIERPLYCLLEHSYMEDEGRVWLKIPPKLAPINVAVFPLVSKENLKEIARSIYNMLLQNGFYVIYDEKGSIGRRYRRMDEVGTPFDITVDYQTIEDGTVTVRDRDTMKQIRIKTEDLAYYLNNKLRL
ncbi:MAG: glycine--tRNA ligase [Candidatus Asgardarchaeia archaeon]